MTKLAGLFYPTEDNHGKAVSFDSLFIPYIYKEIYFDGVYVDILNGRTDMTILDIGANIGICTDHFRSHAKRIYSVEPSPEHFAALRKNKEFNSWDNVEIFNLALADKDGEMSFTQNEYNRTMNSLVTDNSKPEGMKVKTLAFDTFLNQNGIDRVDFCKFDVEGSEDLILRSAGFRKVADKIRAIEVEFHFPTWPQLVEYMISLGFQARRYPCEAIVILFTK